MDAVRHADQALFLADAARASLRAALETLQPRGWEYIDATFLGGLFNEMGFSRKAATFAGHLWNANRCLIELGRECDALNALSRDAPIETPQLTLDFLGRLTGIDDFVGLSARKKGAAHVHVVLQSLEGVVRRLDLYRGPLAARLGR